MKPHTPRAGSRPRLAIYLLPVVALVFALLAFAPHIASAANPPPQQTYYVSLPEDDLLKLFDDDDAAGGTFPDPTSPIRSITSISIGSSGTLVYYDQWEDGSYDADIANPGANVYANPGNLDGTQIWGDGVLSNGCPPNITNVPNPCTAAADDLLQAGDVIILDNDVIVGGTSPGPYTRSASLIFYDGRDKFGTSFPVAVTRAAFPVSPGSVMAGANEVLDVQRWGTSYRAPVGENITTGTSAFEDVRWFIMAGAGGATISVDANGDGDYLDANDLNGVALAEGAKRSVNGILVNATLAVTAGNAVQVNSMTADVNDTFEFRWDALLPRPVWTSDYYSPVGTQPKTNNSGCTEVWIHNPNASSITVNIDLPDAGNPNGTRTVPANSTLEWPTAGTNLYDKGFRIYTTGSPAPVFLPIQIVDCSKDTSSTDGRLYDWGTPLFPANQLTAQVLVPFAQGCSGESFLGVCRDADSDSSGARDVTTDGSRSVVWVTPLANAKIWIDYDGSGFSCPSGAGAETSIPTGAGTATALTSYRITNDPTSRAYVRHSFGSGNYTGTDNIGQGWPQTSSAWANNWTETGDEGTSGAGAIQVVSNELRFGNTGSLNETGWTVRRGVNLTGQNYANLRFHLRDNGLTATDKLAVEATKDGTNWVRLATFQGDQVAATYDPIAATFGVNISPYISASAAVRFVILTDITSANFWFVDDVHIDYAVGGDWDMTGARIGTCDGTKIAAAWGQDPDLSGGNDEEALDMGTGIAPFGSDIAIDKSADKTVVAEGGLVNYTFAVTNLGAVNLVAPITVTDDKCPSPVYVSGDDNPNDGKLNPFPAETWYFTCSSNIYFKTTNVAYATGTPEGETTPINSSPDEWTVDVLLSSAIGNYVWLDEDGDGDQDAGEAGIPNVKVTLTGTDVDGKAVNLTVYTDANGGYLFDGLPASNGTGYTVTIFPPAGLNNTYDEDTGTVSPNNTTNVVLAAGVEHLTADFGLNWAPAGDTNNPPLNATGAIGDRVWIDADVDGKQDLGEAGLGGVTVSLLVDSNGDGVYGGAGDTPAVTTVTDAAGNYIFDGLPPGAYVVRVTLPAGYNQTGDPDSWGAPCSGACDNQTTKPIVLGPGDVYVNADFGYQPTGASGSIGDTVWLDADRNNSQNGSEPGIPSVTVALIKDSNGNGVWDVGEPIIATTITGDNPATGGVVETGWYQFTGLPITDGSGTDDYLVWVNDTNHVLGELAPVYDVRDGANQGNPATGVVSGLEISAITNLDGTPVTNADFAYAPPGHDAGEGLIGDTVWLDRDGNNQFDTGEGLEKVKVTLTDPGPDGDLTTTDDNSTRSTYTDENGHYFFGGLEPSLSYRVTVDTTTLPAGVTNTVDPDGTTDSTTVRNLAVTGPVDLAADFAYRDTSNPNRIEGTLWEDLDADGILDAGEAVRFANVTVVLKNANGDVVATTTTNGSGDYVFSGLPDGTYTVDVTDDANLLNGYWHSLGDQSVGSDGTSKVDPFTVSVAGGQTITTVDFGYYIKPAALGNFVWFDDLPGTNATDGNGIQDPGELGIDGLKVTLTVLYPNGTTTTLVTTTGDDPNTAGTQHGWFSFGNLLLDEDYSASTTGTPNTAGLPRYNISVPTGTGYTPSPSDQGGNDMKDSDPNGVAAQATKGSNSVNQNADPTLESNPSAGYDFGFTATPTSVTLRTLQATPQSSWEAVLELLRQLAQPTAR